ncbi:hypothetical protein [Pelagicoccus sp. SDUM812003]|uniref:hypothetical protein n=1 Tax=Pelagicoccus sp. SDUM812003 TaxID=3041267 RepID=UPI00280C808B|nr:hypothetical protein [Pelagicoccus sp. SDUM812003]MDQ8202524.1 hypothetical protein [Pelagicoccus sp. SDUM812003]
MLASLKWLTLLSLDAPLVAVVWQAMLAQTLGGVIHWHHRALVFSSVWLGYAADRWFDSLLNPQAPSAQHRYMRRFAKPYVAVWSAVLLLSLALAWARLEPTEWTRGTALVAAALLYTTFAQKGRSLPAYGVIKGFLVAALVSASAALFVKDVWSFNALSIHVLATTALLYACNCLLIRSWEKRHSYAKPANRFLIPITALSAALGLILHPDQWSFGLSALASLLLLGFVHRFRSSFGPIASRALADICLLAPLPFLLVP